MDATIASHQMSSPARSWFLIRVIRVAFGHIRVLRISLTRMSSNETNDREWPGRLPQKSNFESLPGKAGGFPMVAIKKAEPSRVRLLCRDGFGLGPDGQLLRVRVPGVPVSWAAPSELGQLEIGVPLHQGDTETTREFLDFPVSFLAEPS
jgi:hypothetical protein